jgi:hypothetical protein
VDSLPPIVPLPLLPVEVEEAGMITCPFSSVTPIALLPFSSETKIFSPDTGSSVSVKITVTVA